MRHRHALRLPLVVLLAAAVSGERRLLSSDIPASLLPSWVASGPKQEFDPASTAQLDSGFLTELTGAKENSPKQSLSFASAPAPVNGPVSKRTLQEVNREAPVYKIPTRNGTVRGKPVASQKTSFTPQDPAATAAAVANHTQGVNGTASLKTPGSAKGSTATAGAVAAQSAALDENATKGEVHSMQLPTGFITPLELAILPNVGGTPLEFLMGIRISMPFFGSGFNICVDRYFGTFPKVGIVIPNPVAWLLPEFQDMAAGISSSLSLPMPGDGAPLGSRLAPTSDGFVIWLPSVQPLQVMEFGFRYGIQVSQLFGTDFGFGWLRGNCGIDFVRV